ncbi:MFS transporter [Nonomuraea sp. NPDC049784]|uniref:MFS transporter n=1 Tax=Nonomuraea sp. NPDC049784 TaxID=3154361 RepID=UPI00340E2B6D
MKPRNPTPALLALSLGYFSLGTTSLAVVGLSAPIGAALNVRPATVGLLVTVFSLVFAVAAPLASVWLGQMCRKRVLLIGLALMIVGGIGSALAPSYGALCAARVLSGLGAAMFGPTASTAGSMIVPERDRPKALATVFAGMTAASVLGVPLSSTVGEALGWRWTVIGVVVLTALSLVLVARLLPAIEPGPAPTFQVFARVLRTPGALPAVSTTLLVLTAQFTVYGVAGAYLASRFAATAATVSLILLAFGALGVIGNMSGSRMHDRLGGSRTVTVTLAGMAVAFAALTVLPGSIAAAVIVFAFWGFSSSLFMAPQQARLVELLPEQRGILLALNATGIYLGMSLGSLIGSHYLSALGAGPLSLLALLPLALAAGAHIVSVRRTTPTMTRTGEAVHVS